MTDFTPTQGRYLAFIHQYTALHGCPPAESEIATAMCVSPPSVNQMVKMLEKKGLILRQPGRARSIRILIPDDQIPPWGSRPKKSLSSSMQRLLRAATVPVAPPADLYVLKVFLVEGATGQKFDGEEISRVIEIRGDQSLELLHDTIFKAYDRWDEHLYEFQFGERLFDGSAPIYGVPHPDFDSGRRTRDASTTNLDDLDLRPRLVFGYWFDFGDSWLHRIKVERIERAIPTVTYPRVVSRIGDSPPQYY